MGSTLVELIEELARYLGRRLDGLERLVRKAMNEVAELEGELGSLEDRLRAKLSSLEDAIAYLGRRLNSVEEAIKAMKANLAGIGASLASLNARVESLESLVESTKDRLSDLETEVETVKNIVGSVEDELYNIAAGLYLSGFLECLREGDVVSASLLDLGAAKMLIAETHERVYLRAYSGQAGSEARELVYKIAKILRSTVPKEIDVELAGPEGQEARPTWASMTRSPC